MEKRETNKLRARAWIEKVTTPQTAIVGERKRERTEDSAKQSQAEHWKPLFRSATNWTFPLACQSPILSPYTASLFPDAQSEVFPLMKRIEFFKLKSLIRNKVFHPFTILSSASLFCTIYNESIYKKGYRSRILPSLVVSKWELWIENRHKFKYCLVHSLWVFLCKATMSRHIPYWNYPKWIVKHLGAIIESLRPYGMSLKLSIRKKLLASKFWHHSYRLCLFSLQEEAELEIDLSEMTGRKGSIFMGGI